MFVPAIGFIVVGVALLMAWSYRQPPTEEAPAPLPSP